MARTSLVLHFDSLSILDEISDQEAGQLFKAIKAYNLNEEYELNPSLKLAFTFFKNQFTRDIEKYNKTSSARAQQGKRGGIAKATNATKGKQKVANVANLADSDSDSDSVSDSKKIPSEEGTQFANWVIKLFSDSVRQRFTDGDLRNWGNLYDALLRKKYSKGDVVAACEWAVADDFWKVQFLSPMKLNRKNKDGVLYIDFFLANAKNSSAVVKSGGAAPPAQNQATIDKMTDSELIKNTFDRITKPRAVPGFTLFINPHTDKWQYRIASREEIEHSENQGNNG